MRIQAYVRAGPVALKALEIASRVWALGRCIILGPKSPESVKESWGAPPRHPPVRDLCLLIPRPLWQSGWTPLQEGKLANRWPRARGHLCSPKWSGAILCSPPEPQICPDPPSPRAVAVTLEVVSHLQMPGDKEGG